MATDLGLLGFDDPKTLGLLSLGLRLMSTPGKFGAALGQSGLGALGDMQAANAQQEDRKRRALQDQMMQMQLEQQRKQQERAAAVEAAYRQAFRSPAQQALAGGGGPTVANAAKLPGLQPSIDQGALIQGLMQADPASAAKMLEGQPDDYKVVGGSLVRVGRNGVSEAYRAPDKPDELDGVLRAAGIMPGTPQYVQAYADRAKKLTTQPPGVQVSYGAPVAGVDEKGNPVFWQPSKDGSRPAIVPGVRPPPKEMNAGAAEKFATNAVTLQKIDKALAGLAEYPDAVGVKNYAPDAVVQRVDPRGVEIRAMLADIGGQKIHDRSGAAVTVGESERLKPYIPSAKDSPETAIKKLRLFRTEYAAMQRALATGATIKQAAAREQQGDASIDDLVKKYGSR